MESESDPLTRRAVDLFEKEPLKGNSEVHLHTPTKFGEDRSKDLGGDREQTDRQTNRQTDKRCSIYSMMISIIHLFLRVWQHAIALLYIHIYLFSISKAIKLQYIFITLMNILFRIFFINLQLCINFTDPPVVN